VKSGSEAVMSDETTSVAELKRLVRAFSQERAWEPFHTPKDLGVALAIEVGELLEHVRYMTDERIAQSLADEKNRKEFSYEVADCVWLLLRLADVVGFDMSDALREKLVLAAEKYPVDRVKGKPDKYTSYG
jgi:dCTP diphosphatase